MTTTTHVTVASPAPVAVPRFAPVAARWFARLLDWQRGAQASRAETQRVINRQAEAAEVRRYAQTMMECDPRFAADLFAAADRHERG